MNGRRRRGGGSRYAVGEGFISRQFALVNAMSFSRVFYFNCVFGFILSALGLDNRKQFARYLSM